jgi:hypothetical protein
MCLGTEHLDPSEKKPSIKLLEKQNNSYSSPVITELKIEYEKGWGIQQTHGKIINAYKILVRKNEGKRPLRRLRR